MVSAAPPTSSRTLSCIDYPFFLSETVTGGSAIASIFSHSSGWTWILYTSTFGLLITSHLLVRRYGNIALITDRIKESATLAEEMEQKADEEVAALEEGRAKQENVQDRTDQNIKKLDQDLSALSFTMKEEEKNLTDAENAVSTLQEEEHRFTEELRRHRLASETLTLELKNFIETNNTMTQATAEAKEAASHLNQLIADSIPEEKEEKTNIEINNTLLRIESAIKNIPRVIQELGNGKEAP